MQKGRDGAKRSIIQQGLLCLALGAVLLSGGCLSKLKEAKPIIPNRAYDKQLLGNTSADYVGNETCLKKCHVHDKIKQDFDGSTMGAQLKVSSSGMTIVDCESCHGPGSAALEDLKNDGLIPEDPNAPISREDKVKMKEIMQINFLNFGALPGPVRSQICLKCHTANADFNLHNWNTGAHALNNVSCSDCHPIHEGANLILHPEQINPMCMKCHQSQAAEFSLPSRHPIKENKIYCTDCHEMHGTTNARILRGLTVKETCARCHTEKAGPFLFEHGDVTEDCGNCHANHGSMNNNLLKLRTPFLCRQCHSSHVVSAATDASGRIERNTRCTDCHSAIHGSDTPGKDVTAPGRFLQ